MVKQFFWVPHRFRHGILVAGGWGNTGDIREHHFLHYSLLLPFPFLAITGEVLTMSLFYFAILEPKKKATSVILSICGSAPFNGTEDQNLSVAYISAFNLVFMVCFDHDFCAISRAVSQWIAFVLYS